jgi:hypothetical protein
MYLLTQQQGVQKVNEVLVWRKMKRKLAEP